MAQEDAFGKSGDEMAYKIGFLVTSDDAVKIVREEAFPEEVARGDVLVARATPFNFREKAQSLVETGAEAIIARGGNYSLLQEMEMEIPIVELKVTTADVLEVLGKYIDNHPTLHSFHITHG